MENSYIHPCWIATLLLPSLLRTPYELMKGDEGRGVTVPVGEQMDLEVEVHEVHGV